MTNSRYNRSTKLFCYEYFSCKQKDCKMFNKKGDAKCWEIEGTMCNIDGADVIKNLGVNKCDVCIYYEAVNSA